MQENSMQGFLKRYGADVIGHFSGWDRLRLRGTLRCIAHGTGLASFLTSCRRKLEDFGEYAEWSSKVLCETAKRLAEQAGRPWVYLGNPGVSKEQKALEIAKRDGIKEGLICMLTAVEPCWSFRLVQYTAGEAIAVQRAYRKCLHIYHYHIHPVFGMMHVRQQTWMPFNLHVCLNGREWLARQMDEARLKYIRRDNCFVWVQDIPRVEHLLDMQVKFKWEEALRKIVEQVTPAIGRVMAPYEPNYYWSIDESEWATDIMFRSESALSAQYHHLIHHGIKSFSSRDVMRFLGQRVPLSGNAHPRDYRDVVSDVKGRPEGIRIKHRLGANSIKMYNKQGSVLRVETTLNNVRELKTPRKRNGKIVWAQMRKGVADARRRAQISDQCNQRYCEALEAVGTVMPLKTLTEGLATPVTWNKQRIRGMNLFAEEDVRLLDIVGRGEFLLNGFRNRDLQGAWFQQAAVDHIETNRRSAKITRKLRLLRAHGLIQKLSHTHRYVVTAKGRQLIAALTAARNANISELTKVA